MLKYLLIGRTGSGRNFFQHLLEEKGLKVAKSYTTREKINDNDNTHHFIDTHAVNTYTDRLFETAHDDQIYFYTKEEIENADIIPIDPENVSAICDYYPDVAFRFLIVYASDADRIAHAVSDAEDKLIAEEEFIASCEEENGAFCKFEDMITSADNKLNISNLLMGHWITNDFTETSDLYYFANTIVEDMHEFNKLSVIINELGDKGILNYDKETDKYALYYTEKPEPDILSLALFTEHTLLSNEGMGYIFRAWLKSDVEESEE